jgi:uncharacterized repeat protein (TIGR03803 family)
MRPCKITFRTTLAASCATALLLITFLSVFPTNARAGTAPVTLHDFFVNSNDGSTVYSGLTPDAAGNLYGTTVDGGTHASGTVFELTLANSKWTEKVIYSFKGGQDGSAPHSNVVFDAAGNLYGSTVSGGPNTKTCNNGCGVVFKLTPPSNGGSWTETILHRFSGGADGGAAYAGVILDAAENLYGSTSQGGSKNQGTFYKLSPNSGGAWHLAVLHNFAGNPDGSFAYATPTFDAAGNIWGTTYSGGTHNQGTVYKLTKQGSSWAEKVVYSFAGGDDGTEPSAGVVFDSDGNVYGTTSEGGSAQVGIAFELIAASGYSESILHTFLGLSAQDGANPNALTFDVAGNLYGTTVGGGKYNPGTIFKLGLSQGGWEETILYNFTGENDGAYPSANLWIDSAGNLYGTTLWGGPAGDTVGGVAFEFVP